MKGINSAIYKLPRIEGKNGIRLVDKWMAEVNFSIDAVNKTEALNIAQQICNEKLEGINISEINIEPLFDFEPDC